MLLTHSWTYTKTVYPEDTYLIEAIVVFSSIISRYYSPEALTIPDRISSVSEKLTKDKATVGYWKISIFADSPELLKPACLQIVEGGE